MLTTQVEVLADTLEEIKPLLVEHYEKLALNQDKVPMAPQWPVYFEKERNGELSLVTLRADGRMVGYWLNFVGPGLHYQGCLTAIMDVWNIHPDHIGGTAPLRLGRAVKAELERRGVQRWFAGEKLHTPCGRLFKALGMEMVERTYSSWLGD